MTRLKTSTSLVLLLAVVPSLPMAKPATPGPGHPEVAQRVQDDRHLLRGRLDAAAATLPDTSDDLSVAQWNNWSNWSNFWNNWNNWANW